MGEEKRFAKKSHELLRRTMFRSLGDDVSGAGEGCHCNSGNLESRRKIFHSRTSTRSISFQVFDHVTTASCLHKHDDDDDY